MPDIRGYEILPASSSRRRLYHHWCGDYIDRDRQTLDEHAATCGAPPSMSEMDWEVAQNLLERPESMRRLLDECDGDANAAALEVRVLTGFRWGPSPAMVRTIAGVRQNPS